MKDIKDTLQEIYKNNKEELLEFIGKEMNTKEVMRELIESDYEEYIKSIISIETNINDEEILNKTYDYYLDKDYVPLISYSLDDFVEYEVYKKKEELTEDLKKAIIDYYNDEFDEDYKYEDFDSVFPDPEKVDLAYTTDPDGEHTIQFSIDLINGEYTHYVDDKPTPSPYLITADWTVLDSLKDMTEMMKTSTFAELVSLDDRDLEYLGLAEDEYGNFYDPKALNQEDDLEI